MELLFKEVEFMLNLSGNLLEEVYKVFEIDLFVINEEVCIVYCCLVLKYYFDCVVILGEDVKKVVEEKF